MERRPEERKSATDPVNEPGRGANSPRYTDPHVDHPHHRAAFGPDEPPGPPTPTTSGASDVAWGRPGRGRTGDEISGIRLRGGPKSETGADSVGGGRTSPRDEIDKIVPGPGHTAEVDDLVRERMEEESPDGRPPDLEDRRKSRNLFYIVLGVVWLVVIGAVWYAGGWEMAALVLVLTAMYIGYASWPVWRAALERRADERRAEREVEMEQHPPTAGAPPDRQPPAQNR